MKRPNPRLLLTSLAVLALASGLAFLGWKADAQSTPTLTLAQDPLFLANRIKPNFIMAVDDSGSMDFEVLLPANDGSAWWNINRRSFFGLNENSQTVAGSEVPNFNGDGVSSNTTWKKYSYLFPMGSGTDGKILNDSTNDHFAIPPTGEYGWARSSDYNRAYFNPLVTYVPWQEYDGTSLGQVSPTSAPADPRRGSRRVNLTQDLVTNGTNAEFMFHRYMVIPAGTIYSVSACYNGGVNPTNILLDSPVTGLLTGYRRALADRTVGGNEGRSRCSVSISYFPATFYVRDTDGRAAAIASAIGYKPGSINRDANSPGDSNGNGQAKLARFEIKPDNFASGAQYTAAINNFANWFTYYRKRQLAARGGLSQAFQGFDYINAGFFTINSRTNVTMRDMALATPRQALFNDILTMDVSGGTPNRDAVDHLGQQFRRRGTGAPITLACQKNFGMLFTDGFSTPTSDTSYGNVDGTQPAPFKDSASNTLADIAMRHYLDNLRPDLEAGKVPVSTQCDGSNPSPQLDCQRNPHMNFFGITLGTRGLLYNPDAVPAQNPFANPPSWPTSFPQYHPSAIDDIWHATINTRGRILNARTPREISSAIRSVLVAVKDASIPSGRDATSGARVSSDTFFLIPSFNTRNDGTDWSGNLVAYRIQPNGTLGTLLWSNGSAGDTGDAADRFPDPNDRNLLTTNKAGTSTTRTVVQFRAGFLGTNATNQYAAIGLSAADVATYPGLTPTKAYDYLRGSRADEQVVDSSGVITSGVLRQRTSILGDIINSTPVVFTKNENFGYQNLPGTAGTSYQTFVTNRARGTQAPVIYVGANDGFLHAFSGTNGRELFGYMPNGALGNVGRLLNPKYQHQYFVDGQITVGDAQLGGGWGSVLVGSTGAGSQSLFALNVTTPGTLSTSSVLWELNPTTTPELGNVLSRALIVPVRGTGGPRWVALVGNGYNSTYGKPALLVIDLATGTTVAALKPNVSTATANGLGNIVAIADAQGYASTVYGGDLDGNVWKFNLSGSTTTAWGVGLGGAPLFKATDANNAKQPITGGLDVARGPNNGIYVFFGTGRYMAVGDNQADSNAQVQTLYGVLDTGVAITGREKLSQRFLQSETSGTPRTRSVSQGKVDYLTQAGWYMDLRVANGAQKGERFLGYPRVEGGQVYFATFEPVGDSCSPGGTNWLYGLDVLTGSASLSNLGLPGVDGNGDGKDDTICTSGCGGVETGTGAPANDTVVLVPQPPCIPGALNCPAPVLCTDNPSDPNCKTPEELGQDALYKGCTKTLSVGGKQIVQPRPCGRQSWRQVR
jgi:type IV pilus assembly protein PilY1